MAKPIAKPMAEPVRQPARLGEYKQKGQQQMAHRYSPDSRPKSASSQNPNTAAGRRESIIVAIS
ncbi:MAG: hypothetical protein B7Y41_02280 [Hydrogenophilales bacterium 28-61-23]|nr:MAG: hypothetical protein B7Y41_02280 [Hydrogenophilales bacterium 28-61-23]